MKKNENSSYRTMSFGKIDAKCKAAKDSPKASKTTSSRDLRVGGKK